MFAAILPHTNQLNNQMLNFQVVENQLWKEFFDSLFLMLGSFQIFKRFRLRSCWLLLLSLRLYKEGYSKRNQNINKMFFWICCNLCYKTIQKLRFKNLNFLVVAPFFWNFHPSDLFLGMLLTLFEHHKLAR